MTLPLLFIMISHHYPMTYGAQRPWVMLALIAAAGVAIRHVFNLRHKQRDPRGYIALGLGLMGAAMAYGAWEKSGAAAGQKDGGQKDGQGSALTYADVQPIFAKHCVGCHAARPTNPAFAAPPLGVMLDSADHAAAVAPRIKAVAVDAQVMPLGNLTGMSDAERARLGQWIAGGAKR